MFAELPMYDLPECRPATDALWQGIARSLQREGVAGVPSRLTRRPEDGEARNPPELLMSQVCGTKLAGPSRQDYVYLATPCFSAPGCSEHRYRSFFVVSAASHAATFEDLRGKRCAINSYSSHSGCNTLRAAFAPLAVDGSFFGSVIVSGGHAQSLAFVGNGQADIAAIDCVTYALLSRFRPQCLDGTRMLSQSIAAPAPPYVGCWTNPEVHIDQLRAGLLKAMIDPQLESVRADLFLCRVTVLSPESYGEIADFTANSARSGYHDFDPLK